MSLLNIGILGTSDFAYRRMLPAIINNSEFNYFGLATRNLQNSEQFVKKYGGKVYQNYLELIEDSSIDVVYIPLPPALHFEWAYKALKHGKHVILEKPFTEKFSQAKKLIKLAKHNGLSIYENFGFSSHPQLEIIKKLISSNKIGKVRLIKSSFGYPKRNSQDFRYNRSLGGGALLDAGVYPLKISRQLLNENVSLQSANLTIDSKYNIDIAGSATLRDSNGLVSQISFGMDNSYKCEIEVWGEMGIIFTDRIFTAPNDFNPKIKLIANSQNEEIIAPMSDQFILMLTDFKKTVQDLNYRFLNFSEILNQADLLNKLKKSAQRKVES